MMGERSKESLESENIWLREQLQFTLRRLYSIGKTVQDQMPPTLVARPKGIALDEFIEQIETEMIELTKVEVAPSQFSTPKSGTR